MTSILYSSPFLFLFVKIGLSVKQSEQSDGHGVGEWPWMAIIRSVQQQRYISLLVAKSRRGVHMKGDP